MSASPWPPFNFPLSVLPPFLDPSELFHWLEPPRFLPLPPLYTFDSQDLQASRERFSESLVPFPCAVPFHSPSSSLLL